MAPIGFPGVLNSVSSRFSTWDTPHGGLGINASTLPDNIVMDPALLGDPAVAEMMRRVVTNYGTSRRQSFSNRHEYQPPANRLDAMRTARIAAERDDVVSGHGDMTESLAFTKLSIFSPEDDEQATWNQIAADLDFDTLVRAGWDRLYIDSQVAVIGVWGDREYEFSDGYGQGGRPRRKTVTVNMPLALSVIDTTRVIPVGEILWGTKYETLAYAASAAEAAAIEDALKAGPSTAEASMLAADFSFTVPTVSSESEPMLQHGPAVLRALFARKYTPDAAEQSELAADGVADTNSLYEFKREAAWRHTLTRSNTERFARVRLESVFGLLDLKANLHASDRAHLLGGANFIVLVTKGTDQLPADQAEIRHLREASQTLGSSTIVTGDHRLKIEIITPKLDVTLNKERYDVLDSRISARILQNVMPSGQSSSDPMKTARLVAAGLESRRHQYKRAIELFVIDQIRRRNPTAFKHRAEMLFSPDSIQLTFDPAYAALLLDMRDTGDLSRTTALAQMGFSATREKVLRLREQSVPNDGTDIPKQAWTTSDDAVFQTTVPGRGASRANGRRGGLRNGGGAAPETNQGGARQNETEDPRGRSDVVGLLAAAQQQAVEDSDVNPRDLIESIAGLFGVTVTIEDEDDAR